MSLLSSGQENNEVRLPVRHLERMGKVRPQPLGDPEEHYVRELCDDLPNPFDPAVSESKWRKLCDEMNLPGPVPGHPGWEVTFLRVRKTLAKLGFFGIDTDTETRISTGTGSRHGGAKNSATCTEANTHATSSLGRDTSGASGTIDGEVCAKTTNGVESGSGERDKEAVLLVTHGATSNILFEILTGSPPAKMATVGSFFLLRRPSSGAGRWVDAAASKGVASSSHIERKGNAAH